ncbi:hypothetical protein BEH61_04215 [Clavibacter michiganensis subsp. insidiosus]|nr:hypothetical protein BEH61_04215 [Clavibacter michiganensis subsp. insidiosus]
MALSSARRRTLSSRSVSSALNCTQTRKITTMLAKNARLSGSCTPRNRAAPESSGGKTLITRATMPATSHHTAWRSRRRRRRRRSITTPTARSAATRVKT